MVVGDMTEQEARRSAASLARRRTSPRNSRLLAEPDTVVIAESTRKLLGNLFDLQDLGTKDLQGNCRPGARLGGIATEPGSKPI